jgi:HSP20 family protein
MASDVIRFMQSLFPRAWDAGQEGTWQPSADIYQTPQGWLVKFDLAGVRPEDVQLSCCGAQLTVRGSRRDWCLEEGCHCYVMEISYSRFERTLRLPCDLEAACIQAEHRDGMLLVRITLKTDR